VTAAGYRVADLDNLSDDEPMNAAEGDRA